MSKHKRILLLGVKPNTVKADATDAFIEAGCRNLLTAAFPGCEIDGQWCPNHSPTKPAYTTHSGVYDLVAVMGSPWLWEGMAHSHKYKNTLKYLQDHSSTPAILMGGGSVYDLDRDSLSHTSLEAAKEFFAHFTTLLVGDHLAERDLKKLHLNPLHFACPAYFGTDDLTYTQHKGEGGAVVWAAPENTLGRNWWTANPEELKATKDEVKRLVTEEGYKLYVTAKSAAADIEAARAMGLKVDGVFNGREDAVHEMNKYRSIYSFRVHNAVPAQVMGKDVTLVAVDTRAHTFRPSFTAAEHSHWKNMWVGALRALVPA